MGFFAEELSENSGVSIPIPDGHQLQVTHVCLDLDAETTGRVILRAKSTNDEQEFNICVLHAGSHRYHEQLNLEFGPEDSPVEFSVDGGTVHLTGNWRWEEDHEHGEECSGSGDEDEEEEEDCEMDEDDDDDEPPELVPYPSDDEEEEEPKPVASKKQKQQEKQDAAKGKGSKKNEKAAAAEAPVVAEKATEVKTAKNAKKEEEEEVVSKSKNSKKRPAAEIQEESAKEEAPNKKKATKESKAAATAVAAPAATATAVPHKLPTWHIVSESDAGGVPVPNPKPVTKKDGLIVTEHVVGKGPLPKPGAYVAILYEGLFLETGETFDHRLKRKSPFTFRRGLGHVIKGMDIGMEGMRVGGARELIVPPNLGYGSKGVGAIPGNQTLVFRIQLIGTH
eukprot:gene17438-12470_t